MATGGDVLQLLIPTGGCVIQADDFDSIRYDNGVKPISACGQDIDFMLKYQMHPNFVIIIPSRKFDGTNALVRMPIDIMKTHYDDNSYRYEYVIFSDVLRKQKIPQYIDNRKDYGRISFAVTKEEFETFWASNKSFFTQI